jgi:hypothetical protein
MCNLKADRELRSFGNGTQHLVLCPVLYKQGSCRDHDQDFGRVAPEPHVVFLMLGLGRVRFAGLLPDPADPIESGGAPDPSDVTGGESGDEQVKPRYLFVLNRYVCAMLPRLFNRFILLNR